MKTPNISPQRDFCRVGTGVDGYAPLKNEGHSPLVSRAEDLTFDLFDRLRASFLIALAPAAGAATGTVRGPPVLRVEPGTAHRPGDDVVYLVGAQVPAYPAHLVCCQERPTHPAVRLAVLTVPAHDARTISSSTRRPRTVPTG